MFDLKEIKKLYSMFSDVEIGEIEIEIGEERVRLELNRNMAKKKVVSQAVESKKPEVKPKENVSEVSVSPSSIYELKSKWVGFFTRVNPKTGEYYVKLRDEVKKGQVVANVRVLGNLLEIKAEEDGKLKEVLIEEGQPIEYGQPIMRFEK